MKKRFTFGKICANYAHRKENLVTVDVELKTRGGEPTFKIDPATGEKEPSGTAPQYLEFTASARVWNRVCTDITIGGQCLDDINNHRTELSDLSTWDLIYTMGNKYHLNGMYAGTPDQEAAVKEWEARGNKYDYTAACEMLKSCGLYEVPFTGITVGKRYNGELYKYGHGWVVQEIPGDDLLKIEHLLSV